MPKHVRSIQCCYCGASALVNVAKPSSNSLKCRECGGGLSACKLVHVYQPPKCTASTADFLSFPASTSGSGGERRLASQWKANDKDDDDDDDRRKKSKRKKKKKGLLDRLEDRLEDLWDDVEDIFD